MRTAATFMRLSQATSFCATFRPVGRPALTRYKDCLEIPISLAACAGPTRLSFRIASMFMDECLAWYIFLVKCNFTLTIFFFALPAYDKCLIDRRAS